MIKIWDDMKFFQCGEWQVIQENLEDLEKAKIKYNPERELLFNALDLVPFEKVRVAIIAQDPYPESKFATGVAFSIPKNCREVPPTLENLFKEYCSDLHLPTPTNGNLEKWCDEGVLLWNAIPSCTAGRSLSHQPWVEWQLLTQEIIEELDQRDQGCVFVFLGGIARQYTKFVTDNSEYLEYSHPVPRASLKSNKPFTGSRMFSTINAKLNEQGLGPIDWRL